MSFTEYQNLKFEVSENIDWLTEGRRWLYNCNYEDRSENIQDVLSLFRTLEGENRLGIDRLEVLKDLLQMKTDYRNLLEMAETFETKRREYKGLLEQISRVLDECSQLERLISICEGKILHDRVGDIKDVCTLFTELEKQHYLGSNRLDILKTMAIEMEKPDLLKQVEEFEKKREQEEDARRAQAVAVWPNARDAGARLIGIVTPHCTFRNAAGGIVVVTTWMILRRCSNLKEFVSAFTETVLPAANTLRAISEGSLCFIVQAENSSALEALWERYQDGTLQRNLQEFLVTEEIKQLADDNVMLTVQIDEKEYKNAISALMITKTQDYWEETCSMTTETSDSGVWSQSAPSESGFNKDTEERIDKWLQHDVSLNILTEPREETRDEESHSASRIMFPTSFASTTETTNYARLCRLLIDVGTQVLRDAFDRIHPPRNLRVVLSSYPVHAALRSLKKKRVLNPIHWGKLYPAIPSSVSSANFSMSLLVLLLRSICGLIPPSTGWDTLPPATDTSIEANIARVKYYRNTVYGHAHQASVDDATFNTYWQEIHDALIGLGGERYEDDINELKTGSMDPVIEEHYKELLHNWKKDEDTVKEKLVEMEDILQAELKQVYESLKTVSEKLDILKKPREATGDEGSSRHHLMASAPSPFSSTWETNNYARLCRLLVDVGYQALRDTFDKIHPPATLHTVLSSHSVHYATLQSLYRGGRKVLNPTQWEKLYPVHSRVTSASFDITLLTVLLKNICGLTPPATGWDRLPPAADTSIADDIARVKYYRNTVYGHGSQASVDDTSFNAYWQEIRDALVRLGGASFKVVIDNLEHDCMDSDIKEHYCALMEQWKKDDDSIKDKLEEMEENIRDELEKLKGEIGSISLELYNLTAPREEVNDEVLCPSGASVASQGKETQPEQFGTSI